MTEQEQFEIPHISYTVSYDDLIGMWVDLYHRDDHVVVIYDPMNHIDYLRQLNVDLDDINLYESKILTIHIMDIDDGIRLCNMISYIEGPYAQLWSLGRLVTDNIEK